MNPYIFTVIFLLMMSLLTSSEVMRFSQNSLENSCYLLSENTLLASEELREYSHLEELRNVTNETPEPRPKTEPEKRKERTSAKRIAKLKINTARPPNNSRLNVYTLLHKEAHEKLPEHFSLYETFARLMRTLYKEAPFFAACPGAEYRILEKLMEKKGETLLFTTPDELASISLEDSQLQEIFFKMLKGGKQAPSLLNYLSFDKIDQPQKQSRKINLLFADPLIIQAIFPTGRVAEKLLTMRAGLWKEILYQEENRLHMEVLEGKGRREYSEELSKALEEILASEGLEVQKYKSYVFDCTLGEPGTVFFVEDSLTHELLREKYIAPK